MLTLIIIANTHSQYQAFIRKWFEQLRSAATMSKHFVWVAPNDPTARFKLECTRGGLYFAVSDPDKDLKLWLKSNGFHCAQMQDLCAPAEVRD